MIIHRPPLLAIDPGVVLGWAFFPQDRKFPVAIGIIKPQVKKEFFLQMHSTVAQVVSVIAEHCPKFVAIEWPGFFDSAGGRAVAGGGSLVKLAFGVGKLAQVAEAFGATFEPIPVAKWKGQLSKRIVEHRIRRILPFSRIEKLQPKQHEWDAIGIGLYCRGLFK